MGLAGDGEGGGGGEVGVGVGSGGGGGGQGVNLASIDHSYSALEYGEEGEVGEREVTAAFEGN